MLERVANCPTMRAVSGLTSQLGSAWAWWIALRFHTASADPRTSPRSASLVGADLDIPTLISEAGLITRYGTRTQAPRNPAWMLDLRPMPSSIHNWRGSRGWMASKPRPYWGLQHICLIALSFRIAYFLSAKAKHVAGRLLKSFLSKIYTLLSTQTVENRSGPARRRNGLSIQKSSGLTNLIPGRQQQREVFARVGETFDIKSKER